jgi:predicted dehydrogenase
MGMVGGGRDAFIGAVHRMAARLDGEIELVAGALSSTPEKSIASGREVGLDHDRNYSSWREMLEREGAKPQAAPDFVTIVTPNHSHFEIARAFAERGFNLVIDKPMVTTVEQAEELARTIKERNIICCVTYNYSGYPMVKQAREMIRSGDLGDIRKVIVEYNQGWLATRLEDSKQKQAAWRANPELAGEGGAIADIGSHAEQLVSYVTGLEIEALCADLSSIVPGRTLDDDANILLRFKGGARGVMIASQVCIGECNHFRLRVWGTKAGIEWQQESPNHLTFNPIDGPERIYHRGESYLCDAAKAATRLPPGHPEAFIEAFANVYRGFANALRRSASKPLAPGFAGGETAPGRAIPDLDFPTVEDGVRGVRFIHAAVNSSRAGAVWIPFK